MSFPCSRTLKYHLLNKHEEYEYKICVNLLSDLLGEVEYNLRTVNNDEIETIKFDLTQKASQFGLINKQLSKKIRSIKTKQNHLIYPYCQHEERTCANLCLEYLSSYSKLIKNYSYTITTVSKGNPFAQGSILSSMNNIYSNNSSSSINESNELTNGRQKRKSIKQTDGSSSPQLKRKTISNVTKTNRTSSNNKTTIVKQQAEQTIKV
jgi:hypothetical protein